MSVGAENQSSQLVPLDPVFYQRLFEHAGLPIFVCGRSGTMRAANELARGVLQSQGIASEPGPLRNVFPERDREVFDNSLQKLVESGVPLEFRTRLTIDDHDVSYAVWLTPLISQSGELERIAVWFHDITARVDLRRAQRKHERLTTLGAMSGAVAHHYNNLLCGIATSLEYAMNMNTMAAMRRAARRTADAVSRASHLTHQLLAFAQADYRAADLADLTEVVLFYVDQNEQRLRQRGVEFNLEWQPIPRIAIPREQMMIVLNNIVSNAVEAMPNGGRIDLSLSPQPNGEQVRLSVADTGPGIAIEHLDRVFEPFFSTRGELMGGNVRHSGMGLAVVHGLVNEMRGDIIASNTPEGGAHFDILLPMDAGDS